MPAGSCAISGRVVRRAPPADTELGSRREPQVSRSLLNRAMMSSISLSFAAGAAALLPITIVNLPQRDTRAKLCDAFPLFYAMHFQSLEFKHYLIQSEILDGAKVFLECGRPGKTGSLLGAGALIGSSAGADTAPSITRTPVRHPEMSMLSMLPPPTTHPPQKFCPIPTTLKLRQKVLPVTLSTSCVSKFHL